VESSSSALREFWRVRDGSGKAWIGFLGVLVIVALAKCRVGLIWCNSKSG
jgi:hypothetical protein